MSQQFDANLNQWILLKKDAIELSNICSNLEIDKKTDCSKNVLMDWLL